MDNEVKRKIFEALHQIMIFSKEKYKIDQRKDEYNLLGGRENSLGNHSQ